VASDVSDKMSLTFTEDKPAYNKAKVRALKLLKDMAK